MDGCRWDYEEMVLEDQEPGKAPLRSATAVVMCSLVGVMYVNAPTIHFLPCKNYKIDPEQYSCPLYKTSVRAGRLSISMLTGYRRRYRYTVYDWAFYEFRIGYRDGH